MTSTTARTAATLSIVGLALAVTTAPVSAAGGDVVTTVSEADRVAAISCWTPERMARLGSDDRLAPAGTTATPWGGPVPPGPSSSRDDDAVIAVDPADGEHVADVAGTQDISFDPVPSPVDTTILGYPVSRLTRGESLVSCVLPSSERLRRPLTCRTRTGDTAFRVV